MEYTGVTFGDCWTKVIAWVQHLIVFNDIVHADALDDVVFNFSINLMAREMSFEIIESVKKPVAEWAFDLLNVESLNMSLYI